MHLLADIALIMLYMCRFTLLCGIYMVEVLIDPLKYLETHKKMFFLFMVNSFFFSHKLIDKKDKVIFFSIHWIQEQNYLERLLTIYPEFQFGRLQEYSLALKYFFIRP